MESSLFGYSMESPLNLRIMSLIRERNSRLMPKNKKRRL
jgi:hypothetical protein